MGILPDRARALLAAAAGRRILVVGDLMLDRYVYGTVDRISPEAPVPVVRVTEDRVMPGGASNVALNLAALGARAAVAGLTGEDPPAGELRRLLDDRGIDVAAVLGDRDLQTTVKTRVIAERQQVVRVDRERPGLPPPALLAAFCRRVADAVAEADGVILEDYGKGVLQQAVVDAVRTAAAPRRIPVGFDPKDNHRLDVDGVTLATPNRREAFLAVARPDPGPAAQPTEDEALLRVVADLYPRLGAAHLLITLGPQGMLLVHRGEPTLHVPTRAREVYDVSGAGDTVVAASLLALAAGATPEEAAELANYAAGVVVGKLGTATCSADELLAHLEEG